MRTRWVSSGRAAIWQTGQLQLGQRGRGGALQDVSFDRLEPQEAFYSDINPGLRLPNDKASVSRSRKFSRAEPMLIRLAAAAGGAFRVDKVGQLTFSGSRV